MAGVWKQARLTSKPGLSSTAPNPPSRQKHKQKQIPDSTFLPPPTTSWSFLNITDYLLQAQNQVGNCRTILILLSSAKISKWWSNAEKYHKENRADVPMCNYWEIRQPPLDEFNSVNIGSAPAIWRSLGRSNGKLDELFAHEELPDCDK